MSQKTPLPMPYLSKLQGNMQPGQSIFIKGHVTGGNRFDVTLHTGPTVAGPNRDDIALCVSGRIDDGKFILNSLKGGEWGKEEKHKIHCKEGEDFDLRIRAHEEHFEIWFQGKDLAKFDYRVPLVQVNHVYVVGEIDLYRCSWEGRYYPVPFQTAIPPGAVAPGKALYIAGVVEKKAERFEIDLKCGNDFVLHMNPRMKEKKIVRNTCRGGVWDDVDEREMEADWPFEKGHAFDKIVRNTCRGGVWDDVDEREMEADWPFEKGHAFDVIVEVDNNEYKIFVDGKEMCTYRHRLPPDSVDNLVIEGDVDIQGVHW